MLKPETPSDQRDPGQSVADWVADELKRYIASGELAPGDRLPGERQLSETLQVSRVSVRSALQINALFPIGVAMAAAMTWALKHTRWGLWVRMVGDSTDAARALGTSVTWTRAWATAAGGAIAGLGGASLSLYYPGSWNEGLSSGQGLIAVALVIFARWRPWACLWAALLFGGAGAVGPALQSVGITGYTYLFNAVPYVLTLVILVLISHRHSRIKGAPATLVA